MATDNVTQTTEEGATNTIVAGIGGGLVGGVAFGAMMTMMMPMIMEGAIPGMYGLAGGLGVGWAIHLFHSAVLGAVFAGIVAAKPDLADSTGKLVGVGVAYGVVLWVVLATFVMPAWVGAMTPMAPPVPDVNPMSLVGHVVYGALLAGVFAAVADR
ncbi:hypothetical protein JCM17823_26490 [Halorubrum gandharaense]